MLDLERGLQKGAELVVDIEGVTDRGLGRGQVEAIVGPQREHITYEVFVRKAVPGDRVRVEVERIRRRRCTCHILEFIEKSPIRIEPRCPHFGRRELSGEGCGGCTYQELSYRHQLAIKERRIKEHFIAEGLDPGLVLPLKGMDQPWFYRNKMVFSFGDTAERDFALGLHPTGYSYEIVNLETCYLQSEFVAKFVPALRRWAIERQLKPWRNTSRDGLLLELMVREGKQTGERMVELVTTADESVSMDGQRVPAQQVGRAFCDFSLAQAEALGQKITSVYWTQKLARKGQSTRWIEHHLHGQAVLHEELHLPDDRSLRFAIHPRAFFQPNTLGAQILYGEVIEKAGLEKGHGKVLDLYSGTGTIGLCLAPFCQEVYGIEMQTDAVENARRNAEYNGIDNIEFFAGDVGDVLKSEQFFPICDEIDLTVVDPPRGGLQRSAIEQILEIGAPHLVYISCNPATLAPNLRDLQKGGYQLEIVQPVDMFPQTYHVECVALLRRS